MSANDTASKGEEKKKHGKISKLKNKFKGITGNLDNLTQRQIPGVSSRTVKEVDEMEIVYKKVYHISHPPCQNYYHRTGNCRNNPKCIKGLGEDEEGIWKSEKELGNNPQQSLRPEGKPYIGLRNLGATCYINSLLQSLFMNRNFRNAVYQWQGEDKLVRSLQLLFAQLQMSQKDYCSPKEITDLLNIQTSVHQDVQEFNNLFMSLLSSKFEKSDNPAVKKFIGSEFSGVNQYETKCKTCGNISARKSAFNELELTIPADKSAVSLNSCMKALIKDETLSDDNKYDCEKCGLTDAVRRLRLVHLPPVLNIQLLRFVYDASRGTKKKLSTMVSFPRTLDMSSYVDGDKNEYTYHLSAVLLHIGSSANAGHYIAHIQDEVTRQWWKFDDSSVTPLDSKEVGDIETPVGAYEYQGTREKAKSIISGLKKNPKVTSANAYMLIYSRKENRNIQDPIPPPDAVCHVDKMNSILRNKLESWLLRRDEILRALASHKAAYKEFMNLATPVSRQGYNWIDSRELATWIRGENKGPINNSGIVCPHNRLDPKKLPYLKIIHSKAWTFLTDQVGGGAPVLDGSSLCFDCAAAIYESTSLQEGRKNEIERMIRLAYSTSGYSRTPPEGYWVPASWLKEWKEVALSGELSSLDPIICRSITCEHGDLGWKTNDRRVVCTEVWSYLRATFPEGPEYPKDVKSCAICRDITEQRVTLMKQRRESRARQKMELPSLFKSLFYREMVTGTYYVVPISWQKQWYIYVSRPDIEYLEPPDLNTLLCSHGKLKYDPVELIDYCINAVVATRVIKAEEWERIKNCYGDPGSEIRLDIVKHKEGLECKSSPGYCEECMVVQKMQDIENQMNYSSAKIWIEVPGQSSLASALIPFGGRSQTSRFSLQVSITDTIHIVKCKILERTNVQPINQELRFRGEVLENGKTVYDHKLIPGARVTLIRVKGKDGYEDGESNTVIAPPPEPIRQNYHVIEQGFAGSLLLANSDDESKKDELEEWECPNCTMINTGSACEVCDLPNPAIFGDAPKEEPLWECKKCTIPNEQASTRCIGCGTPR